jgi:MYXO-CTERM domain-containing protein
MASGTGGARETGATGSGGSSSGGPGSEGSCGCDVAGSPTSRGAMWLALGLVLAARRKRSREERVMVG